MDTSIIAGDVDSSADRVVADVAAKHGGLSIRDTLQAAYILAVEKAITLRDTNKILAHAWTQTAIEIGVRRNLHEKVIA